MSVPVSDYRFTQAYGEPRALVYQCRPYKLHKAYIKLPHSLQAYKELMFYLKAYIAYIELLYSL